MTIRDNRIILGSSYILSIPLLQGGGSSYGMLMQPKFGIRSMLGLRVITFLTSWEMYITPIEPLSKHGKTSDPSFHTSWKMTKLGNA